MSCHFTANNATYVRTFDKGDLPLAVNQKLIILTCMDARIEPLRQLGFDLGEVHVLRNAGGLAREALRSIIISQRLLGTCDIAVFRHTDCAMKNFTTEGLRAIIKDEYPDNPTVHDAVNQINFLEIPVSLEESARRDVQFLKDNVLIPENTIITGYIYDVKCGSVTNVC